jgi:Na+/H+ antiporter NhaD/arsenite permease-like protein
LNRTSWLFAHRIHESHTPLTLAMAHAGGNLTITGSVANTIVVEKARYEAAVSFCDYFRIGLPLRF